MSPRPAAAHAGFTLLELMVVLGIMGVAASLAVAWLDRSLGQPLEVATERLQRDLASAGEQAWLGGRVIGWRPDATGYRFMALHQGRWIPLGERTLRPVHWPEGLTLEAPRAREADVMPAWIWWPDGEIAGSEITLRLGTGAARIAPPTLGPGAPAGPQVMR
ncbi:prepilin-type N-terminal cleavage/methylation domain-containing protein [Halomonas campaniensis]|uniref:prepilin-type N-terminal cleavage/methylation domain-containing protein n=1 Tax=Halomonas campaniensis TaxID=213554 RepID=UPI003CCD41E9